MKKPYPASFLLVFIVFSCLTLNGAGLKEVLSFAEQESQKPITQTAPSVQPAVQPKPPVAPAEAQPQPAPQPQPKRGDISFNFDDADVFSVIQTIFGDVLKVNYIIDPRVKGRVNFRSVAPVANEDVLPLMEVILRLNGVGIVEEGGLFRLVPISDLSREPASVGIGRDADKLRVTGKALIQAVPVHYIQSSEMVRVLSPFLSTSALIVDVPKSNYIIIVDTDSNVRRLLQLVEIFDSEKLKQVTPQVYVYPVQNSKAKDVASLLQQIFLGSKAAPKTAATVQRSTLPPQFQPVQTQPVQQPPLPAASGSVGEALVSETTRIIPDEVTNSIVVLATPEDYAFIEKTIREMDIVPRQVVIEGIIARVDLTDKLNFGMQWTLQNEFNITGINPFKDVNINGPLMLDTGITSPTFTFTAYDMANNVKLLLQSLATDGKAKILASPHILVSDNREARIQVGSQIPIATQTTTTPVAGGTTTSSTISSTVQYKDIGIILKVKPQVNDSGLVSLEISQEVSSRGDKVTIAGQEFESINKTEATTNLVAQDGETIVIGGLIREDTTKTRSGIPFLSRIPLLGYLFGSTIDESTRNELIILLTPHVIKNQKEAGDVTSNYVNKFKGSTKDEQIDDFIRERGAKGKGKDSGKRP